jgi:hypothetical protein
MMSVQGKNGDHIAGGDLASAWIAGGKHRQVCDYQISVQEHVFNGALKLTTLQLEASRCLTQEKAAFEKLISSTEFIWNKRLPLFIYRNSKRLL